MNWDEYAKNIGTTFFPTNILIKYSGSKILDVGCGIGRHLDSLGNRELKVGLEISIEALKKGRRFCTNVDFVQANAYEMPFRNSVFDTVIMIDVIEHLEYPERALEEIKRLLQDRGYLILQTPNYPVKRVYDFVNYINPRGWRKSFADDPTHVSKFSWRAIEKLVGEALSISESRTRNILLESKLGFLKGIKKSLLGKLIGQKTIIIARKERSINRST